MQQNARDYVVCARTLMATHMRFLFRATRHSSRVLFVLICNMDAAIVHSQYNRLPDGQFAKLIICVTEENR